MSKLLKIEIQKIMPKSMCISLVFITIGFLCVLMIMSIYKTPASEKYNFLEKVNYILENKDNSHSSTIQNDDLKFCLSKTKEILLNSNNYDEYGNFEIRNEDDLNFYQNNMNLINLLTRVYSPIGTFDPSCLLKINENDVSINDIFSSRIENIRLYKNDYVDNTLNIKDSIRLENALGWQVLLENNFSLTIFIYIICSFICASVFSNEYRFNIIYVIQTCKLGKIKILGKKLLASFSISFFIYLYIYLIFTICTLCFFGSQGYDSLIQTNYMYWLSPFVLTNLQAFLLNLIIGATGLFGTVSISLFLSYFIKKSYVSLSISLIVIFLPIFFSTRFPNICFFPSNIIDVSMNLLCFQWLGSIHMLWFKMILIILCGILLILSLRKREKSDKDII